ncbi:AbrB/MazE/SpoVT family DNA-binding domain-containing protein [Umezawaea sp. Da 62-37]|uniref:AbrB/MazE/SpoVT family DNA-binding domain-containing protein n=1 Tax=Umezawaea sp. Da 62-37 TaxID=3075927 RepID=UPI0028F73934|nr:AbrB/MazE/SpoVT family DNA-binding domain-containing protein [Umezawaea sp. Da 62-37]WNV84867.1 AbrB/MazE/SpoVT family DNA-binding domain-containing protein [Umezawaea sp. Da 62-37]
MAEQSTPLFVPPIPGRRATVAIEQIPVLTPPPRLDLAAVMIGAATVDRSSRISQRILVRALGWHTGDGLHSWLDHGTVHMRRSTDGLHRVDERQQIYLPASLRALLDIGIGDRVLLATQPSIGTLVIYPAAVIAALLVDAHLLPAGDIDADDGEVRDELHSRTPSVVPTGTCFAAVDG